MMNRMMLCAAFLVVVLVAGGCLSAADTGGRGPTGPTPPISASPQPAVPVASPSAIVSSTSSPGGSASPVPSAASLDVSPAEVHLGALVLSLAFEPPRHMVDQTAVFNAEIAQVPAPPTPAAPDAASRGAVVLNDMMHVTNNMDPTQPVPADSAQSIVRHFVVQVGTGDTAQAVPYLGVSIDVLLDGHPVSFGQAAVPMVASNADPPRLYYGNNIRLAQRGTYQVFVRLSRNPLLAKDQPQAAQFNVLVR